MSLIKQVRSGIGWTLMKQVSVQGINFGVQIILARLLVPSDFGLIAMIMVFLAIGQSLMDSGMTSSLIRCESVSDIDYSTVFVSNIGVSLIVYLLVYISAPFIAEFYGQLILNDILRVYSLVFVINSFNAVQLAKFTRELEFKKQFSYQLPSVIIGAAVGLYLAFNGYGIWSIIFLGLSQSFFYVIITWTISSWKPQFKYSNTVFKKHFNFGYKLTLSGLIDTLYQNLYKILIGKYFNATAVGFFSQADNLRLFPINQMTLVLDKVTYPVFSKISDDILLKDAFKSAMRLVLSLSSSFMFVLILIAKPLFIAMLGEKWLPSVPYFQILCIASIMRPIGSYNLNILKVKGRSDLFLKVEAIKKVIGVTAIVLSIPFGIEGLVWGLCITNVFFAYFNGFFSGRLINYKLIEQIKDTAPILILSIVPALICLFILPDINNIYAKLIIIPCVYFIQYFLLTFFFNKELIVDIKRFLKK